MPGAGAVVAANYTYHMAKPDGGEIVCRQMDVPPHFGREPFDGCHNRGFDRHIFQGGPKRDSRLAEVPTLFELLDQYKVPAIMRSLTGIVLASGEMGRP